MRPEEAWGPRWAGCAHPLAHQYMEMASSKQSLVVLAADVPEIDGIVSLVREVGPHIVALKTHVDMIEGFTLEGWQRVVEAARENGLLLFEDRKFADIGRVAQTQMGGLYDMQN